MPKEVQRWRCDWCCEIAVTMRGILEHEEGCLYRGLNRACETCRNFAGLREIVRCKVGVPPFNNAHDAWTICPSWARKLATSPALDAGSAGG